MDSEQRRLLIAGLSDAGREIVSGAGLYEPVGCPACDGSGYRGRVGIFEILRVSEGIEELIIKRASAAAIRGVARAEGMTTLREAGLRKAAQGETSIAEVMEHTIADVEEPAPAAMER